MKNLSQEIENITRDLLLDNKRILDMLTSFNFNIDKSFPCNSKCMVNVDGKKRKNSFDTVTAKKIE